MEDLGYESHNAIKNLGTLALLVSWYCIKLLIYFIMRLVHSSERRPFVQSKKIERWLAKQLFFTELIVIFIEGFLEFLIAGYLNNRRVLTSTFGEVFSFLLA